jgi:hypothetical protein
MIIPCHTLSKRPGKRGSKKIGERDTQGGEMEVSTQKIRWVEREREREREMEEGEREREIERW